MKNKNRLLKILLFSILIIASLVTYLSYGVKEKTTSTKLDFDNNRSRITEILTSKSILLDMKIQRRKGNYDLLHYYVKGDDIDKLNVYDDYSLKDVFNDYIYELDDVNNHETKGIKYYVYDKTDEKIFFTNSKKNLKNAFETQDKKVLNDYQWYATIDYDENGKYAKNRVKLTDLKEVMTKWQDTMHECDGWNSLYWSNHDQARAVSRFGNESEPYRVKSAKMLGTILHMMQGTPYIYEGEELGMTNAHFESIDEYKDVEALDIFRDFTERKGFSEKDTLELLGLKSRDNARTPMQWDNTVNAGFTEGTPWIGVNKNCKEINVEQCLADQDSIFSYYQKLIQLRHEMPIITDGVYELLDKENESVYAYLRKGEKETLLVVGNFTDKTINYHIEEKVQAKKSRLLISNYNAAETFERDLSLEPYGACVYLLEAEK